MASPDPVSLAIMGLSTMSTIQKQKAARKNAVRRHRTRQATRVEQLRQAERDRKDALKRAVAKKRARFGASGLIAGGGSSSAILKGLSRQSEQLAADQRRLSGLSVTGRPSLFDDKLGLAANLLDTVNTRMPIMGLFDSRKGTE